MSLFIIGIAYSFITGRVDVVNQAILQGATSAVTLVSSLAGVLIFWTGILQVANKAKMLDLLAILLMPITKILYPKLPRDHKATKYLTTNMISNLLGLSSVATGAGIKAIEALQETNPDKGNPSFEMYTLLVVNTAGLALIPTTVITLRSTFNAINPTDVYLPIILTASISTLLGLIIHNIWSRIKKIVSSGR
jgi:spore maturation protein A